MPGLASAVELSLERPVHGGYCLARMSGGRLALVRGGIPGETVLADLRESKGVLLGDVTEVIEPSPERVVPPAHPGLDLAHASYPAQLEIKRAVVEDAMSRALRRPIAVPPVIASDPIWRYRSVVQPAVARAGTTGDVLGYRVPGTHDVEILAVDPVATTSVQTAWDLVEGLGGEAAPTSHTLDGHGVREVVIRANEAGEALVTLVATAPARRLIDLAHALVDAGIAGVAHAAYDPRGRFRSGFERLAGARSIRQRYGAVELTVGHGSFAQPNVAAATRLYADLARTAIPERGSGSGGHAVDLYAGGGPIAMHLASGFERVTAFELDRSAITHAAADAKRQGFGNVDFIRGDAKRQQIPAGAELLVVDPPRSGLSKEVRDALEGSDAARLLYVSCDASTFARDVADLESRGFALRTWQPYDFYPHTHHVELLGQLERDAAVS